MALRLRELRDNKNTSQEDIAAAAGVSQSTWSLWEKHPPAQFRALFKLAKKYKVSVDYLLGVNDNPFGMRELEPDEVILLQQWHALPGEQRAVLAGLLQDGEAVASILNTVKALTRYNATAGRVHIFGEEEAGKEGE